MEGVWLPGFAYYQQVASSSPPLCVKAAPCRGNLADHNNCSLRHDQFSLPQGFAPDCRDVRFSCSDNVSNEDMRRHIGAPSLQCLVLRKRLRLTLAIVISDMPHLSALLSCHAPGGKPLPWVRLVQQDLATMAEFHKEKLRELGDPGSP